MYHKKVKNSGPLTAELSAIRRHDWQKEIASGKIKVNGKIVSSSYFVKKNDYIEYDSGFIEPAVDGTYKILYEDEYCLAVGKSGNLPVHPSGAFLHHTLHAELLKKFPAVHFVSRLDRETSGIVFCAKKSGQVKNFVQALGKSRKMYLVLTHGISRQKRFTVSMMLAAKTGALVRKRQGENPAGKFSQTAFRVVKCSGDFSLLAAFPLTGRMHQIRAHLREKGFFIAGDKIYGPDENFYLDFIAGKLAENYSGIPGLFRQFLHCSRLSFLHPFLGKRIIIRSPLPKDLKQALSGCGFISLTNKTIKTVTVY